MEDVFDFYGPDVNQYEIAEAAETDIAIMGTYTSGMIRAAHFSDLSTSEGNEMPGSITGYTARGLGYAAFETGFRYIGKIAALKPLIDAGYPIIVLQEEWAGCNWGHFRVVIGYDDATSTIYVKDPNPNPESYTYAAFEDLWDWSINMWGALVCPWQVSVSSPASVAQGDTFTVTAAATYPRPSPFTAAYSASLSKATIQLPPGLSLAASETTSKTLGTGTMASGSSASVQWNVKADSAGAFTISVEAEGRISGPDRIGGTGGAGVTVSGQALLPPEASFTESAHTASVGTPITFNPSGSTDPDGTIVLYEWDWDGDGTYDYSTSSSAPLSHTYNTPGTYTVTLRVTDSQGLTDTASDTKTITPIEAKQIWSSDSSGNPQDTFTVGETVYVTVPATGETVTLYTVADQTAWNNGDSLTDVSSDGSETLTLNPGPGTQTIPIWSPAQVIGSYDIVMDVDKDGVFDQGLDLVDSVQVTGFFVVPEVPFGSIMTLLGMFTAVVGFVGFKRFRPKIRLLQK